MGLREIRRGRKGEGAFRGARLFVFSLQHTFESPRKGGSQSDQKWPGVIPDTV